MSIAPFDYDALGNVHPKLARGRVWCRKCGFTFSFKASGGLQYGWPKCCRETMTIDSPEERSVSDGPKGQGNPATDEPLPTPPADAKVMK